MKINHMWQLMDEVRSVLDFYDTKRWDEFHRRLRIGDFASPEAHTMDELLHKKFILKAIQDLKLLIEKAEKDVRD